MKLTRNGAKEKCRKLWGKVVIARDKKCLMCGREHGKLDPHHGVAARGRCVGAHWFTLENGFTLCFQCHMKVHGREGHMGFWDRWVELVRNTVSQEKRDEIIRAKSYAPKYTLEDYEAIYENLAKEYDRITGAA